MHADYTLLKSLPKTVAPSILDTMPLPMICFNDNLESMYFNTAFANYIDFDRADPILLAKIGTLSATDIMPEYQPGGLHSAKTLHEFMKIAMEDGSHQYPWMLKSLTGKPISAQLLIISTSDTETYYINCYFLANQDKVKPAQAPTRFGEITSHLEHVINDPIDKKFLYRPETKLIGDKNESLPLIMHIWSSDLELIDCSFEAASVFGIKDKDEFKNKFLTFSPPEQIGRDSKELMLEYLQKAFKQGFYKFKWLHSDAKGKIFPCEVTLSRITYENKQFLLGYTQDLTYLSSRIQEFSKTQESTRAMLDAAPMAIVLWDSSFSLRDTNLECARLYGFDSAKDFKDNFRKIIPRFQKDGSSSLQAIQEALNRAFEDSYFRTEFVTHHPHDRTLIPVEVTMIRLNIWNEDVVVAYLRDLRDRKALIEKMQSAEERIQTIFDITPLGINVWDVSFDLIECNDAIVKMYGFESKQAYISARYKVIPRVQPDGTSTVPLAREMIQQAFEIGYSHIEMMTYDIHGNPIPIEVISKRAYVQKQEVIVSYVRDLRDLKAKLSEIEAVQKQLRSARDVAEQSAKTKTQFLGNMSHEIRTPLNGVLGIFHLLDTTNLDDSQRIYLQKGIDSAVKLLNTVDDILDFSKIDAGTFEVDIAPFTLEEIVHEVKLVYSTQASLKNLTLECIVDQKAEETFYGDASRLKQVIFHIMNNAIKFTEEGYIALKIVCTEQSCDTAKFLFSIEDSGIGISKSQCLHIFAPFMQADSSITRNFEGSGLGLAIAKRIIKLMDGDMWVKSEPEKGSTFFFNVELKRNEESKIQAPVQVQSDVIEKEPASSDSLANILLVEDNDVTQLITVELLKRKGYSIDIANNGQEALDMIEKKKYDMLLMDIQMPVMDGLTATSKIRAIERFKDLPIVAMSAHAMKGDKELCLQYGMNDHIAKPVIPDVLYQSVKKWTEKP